MPNWTENDLFVSGDKIELEEFCKIPFTAEAYVPPPTNTEEIKESFMQLNDEDKIFYVKIYTRFSEKQDPNSTAYISI